MRASAQDDGLFMHPFYYTAVIYRAFRRHIF